METFQLKNPQNEKSSKLKKSQPPLLAMFIYSLAVPTLDNHQFHVGTLISFIQDRGFGILLKEKLRKMGSSKSAGDDGREIRIGGRPELPPLPTLDARIIPNQEMGLFGTVVKVVVHSKVFDIKLIASYNRLEKLPVVYKIRNITFVGSIGELLEYDEDTGCIVQFHCTRELPIEVEEGELLWFVREIANDDDENVAVAEQNQGRRSVLSPFAASFFPSPQVTSVQGHYQSSSDQIQGGIGYPGNVTNAGSGSSTNLIPQVVKPPQGGGWQYPWSPVQGRIGYPGNVPPYDGSGSSNVILQEHHQMVTPPGRGFQYPPSPVQGGFSFQPQTNPGGLSLQGGIAHAGSSSSNVIPQQYYPMVPPPPPPPPPGRLVYLPSQGPVQGMPNNNPSLVIGTPSQHTVVPRNSSEQAIMPPNQPSQIGGNHHLLPDR